MLDKLIRASLEHRLLVVVAAGVLLVMGAVELARRPVDIFPDLNQPVVTVLAEAPGLAPDEVETLVTLPLESALAGAAGVERIRSTSGEGLAIVRADFGWGTDLMRDRQLVQERLQLAREDLPAGVVPEMAPISSITGEVLDLSLVSPDGSRDPMELRSLAEWVVRRRLMSVSGVSQVVIIGGEAKQFQVLADPDLLLHHGVGLMELADALAESSRNTSGGYLLGGAGERQVRNLGRVRNVKDLKRVVVAGQRERPVRVGDVAQVQTGPAFARGGASVGGKPAVMLMVFKQPEADTLALTEALDKELDAIARGLPAGVVLDKDLFRQARFLRRGVDNVIEALRDGAILVVIILMLFLFSLRASLVTLVALPLSFATAGVLFSLFDLSLNTMTLGGLAIAVGELVDDAIVGVENVVRRLGLAKDRSSPDWYACLVADASSEVRGPIFSGTLVVVLVFLPLFALSGIEGRLFSPLGLAYVVSLLASMIVSLTVTPVLALWFLKPRAAEMFSAPTSAPRRSPVLTGLQAAAGWLIVKAVRWRWAVMGGSLVLLGLGALGASRLGSQFLPDFDEGTILVLQILPPGTSLAESERVAGLAEKRLLDMPGLRRVARYTGRGEHDEHAPPVGISHLLVELEQVGDVSREETLSEVRRRLADLKGVELSVGQPLAHRIDHLLSGVQAQIAIKLVGPDLDALRRAAQAVADKAKTVEGVIDLVVEPLVLVPQVHVDMRRERLSELGLSPGQLAKELEVAIGGKVVGHILEGERSFDLFVRLAQAPRASLAELRNLPIRLPNGGWARLGEVAELRESAGPNSIRRDQGMRRLAVSCNASGRSVGEVVADLRRTLAPLEAALPEGHSLSFEGQFASQQRATRLILLLSLLSLAAMMLVLYGQFRSFSLALQVLVCVPVAFLGGVAALLISGQPFSVAAMVGFVSLAGIATRNGILLLAHLLELMRRGQITASLELLVQAGRERTAPVVMTALTTGVGLLPLLLSQGETGREILVPVATVVVGGLLTSTLFEFLLRPALFWAFGRKVAEKVVFVRKEC